MHQDLDQAKLGTTVKPVVDLFIRRWSPRAFTQQPVESDKLKAIFSAGQWAASSLNEQPWRFVVGHNGDRVWEHIFASLAPPNQVWTKSAPILFASFAKRTFGGDGPFKDAPNRAAHHDTGMASAQIALQATALGLHTHPMGGFDPEKLTTGLNVPIDFEALACWALGYRGDPNSLEGRFKELELEARSRKPLGERVFSDWGTSAF